MFSSYMIGNEVTDHLPKFLPYTASASCSAVSEADMFTTSLCTSSQYSFRSCKECSSKIDQCTQCTFDENAPLQVICSDCDTGYTLITL